jgi:ATP-dependent protease ClpP protease subunit
MLPMTVHIPKEPERIWDLPVPILVVEETKQVSVYITNSIQEPYVYDELTHVLRTLDSSYTVNFYLSTPGGHLDSAVILIDAIRTCAATTVAHVSGEVASAGTMITLACDQINVRPHSSFMIHYYSGMLGGKGSDIQQQQTHMDKSVKLLYNDIYKDFLTTREITRVINGTDVWLLADEVTERWNKVLEARNVK